MIALLSMMLAAAPTSVQSGRLDATGGLIELLRLSDEYRQCLILDKSRAADPRDTYSATGGTSAENLDLMLSDRQDRLLKRLITQGKQSVIVDAIRQVRYTQVNDKHCRDFDPYYDPALEKLEDLEKIVGIEAAGGQHRRRHQHSR